MMMMT
jgi:hypothetical protein